MRSPVHTRAAALAAIVTTGLATAAVSVLAPADAAGSAVDYTCTVSIFPAQTFSVTNTSSGPATLYVGQSAPIKLTSKVTIPSDFVGTIYGAGGRSADGTADAQGTAGGATTAAKLIVPKTPIPASGDLTITATGRTSSPFKATRAGRAALKAGDFTAHLNIYDASGTAMFSNAEAQCTAPAGVDTTFGAIAVKKDTTRIAVAPASRAGKVTAKVAVRSTHGSTAAGRVTVLVQKGTKVLETQRATLRKGHATVKLPKRLKKGTYTVTATYAGNGNLIGSASKHTVKVG